MKVDTKVVERLAEFFARSVAPVAGFALLWLLLLALLYWLCSTGFAPLALLVPWLLLLPLLFFLAGFALLWLLLLPFCGSCGCRGSFLAEHECCLTVFSTQDQ